MEEENQITYGEAIAKGVATVMFYSMNDSILSLEKKEGIRPSDKFNKFIDTVIEMVGEDIFVNDLECKTIDYVQEQMVEAFTQTLSKIFSDVEKRLELEKMVEGCMGDTKE